MWVGFVVGSSPCLKGFSLGSVFLPPKKPTHHNPIWSGNSGTGLLALLLHGSITLTKKHYMYLFYCSVFRIHVCTWNVKVTQPPDEDFRSFLHLDNEEQLPDIVAVGYGSHLALCWRWSFYLLNKYKLLNWDAVRLYQLDCRSEDYIYLTLLSFSWRKAVQIIPIN